MIKSIIQQGKGIILIVIFLLPLTEVPAQKIALQLYSLRNQLKTDVERYHEIINQWGIRYIEGGDTYDLPLKTYQDLLDKYNLQVISVGGSYEEMRDNPQAVIDKAKAFGAKYIVTFWIPHTNSLFGEKETKAAVDLFNKAGKLVQDAGLIYCYHPHGYEFKPYGTGTLFDYMASNASHFNFQMDVFWVQMGGVDPLTLLKKYPEKFPLLHLKDRKIGTQGTSDGTGDVESNVVLGTGDIDIAGIIRKAKEIGVEYLIIEDESTRSISQIPQSVSYINSILSE
jgi:sugar phosphate isomerase/epimerase